MAEATGIARGAVAATANDDVNMMPTATWSACSDSTYDATAVLAAGGTFTATAKDTNNTVITCQNDTGVCSGQVKLATDL